MKRLLLPALLTAAALGACSTYGPAYGPPPPQVLPPPDAPFRAEDFAWSQAPGAAAVRGSVAYQGAAGLYSCAGASVALIPDTPYSRGRIVRLYGVTDRAAVPISTVRARQEGRAGEAYSAFVRTSKCGPEGVFAFDRLPPGSWFLVATAKAPAAAKAETVVLLRRVRVRPGQQLQLVLQ